MNSLRVTMAESPPCQNFLTPLAVCRREELLENFRVNIATNRPGLAAAASHMCPSAAASRGDVASREALDGSFLGVNVTAELLSWEDCAPSAGAPTHLPTHAPADPPTGARTLRHSCHVILGAELIHQEKGKIYC